MSNRSESEDIDRALRALVFPSGDAAYRHVRGDAMDYLLEPEQAEDAHARLLDLAAAPDPSVFVLLALPRFGRQESVPVLAGLLTEASEPTAVIAAQALGRHPDPAARAALERALGNGDDQVVAAAVDGLAERGGQESCAALEAALLHANPDVVERVRDAMRVLGCGAERT